MRLCFCHWTKVQLRCRAAVGSLRAFEMASGRSSDHPPWSQGRTPIQPSMMVICSFGWPVVCGRAGLFSLALGPIVIRDTTAANAVIIQPMRDVRGDSEIAWRLRQALLGVCVAAVLVGTTAANDVPLVNGLHRSGTVTIDQSQQWFLASAAGRGGVLHFGGTHISFRDRGHDCGPKQRDAATSTRNCLQFEVS